MKLACVVHRFGDEIAGGSETHCRMIAERLAATHDVTVLTTCAKDHVTWRNAYPPGTSRSGALHVERFPVVRERQLERFAQISTVAFRPDASIDQQHQWFRENGPDAPQLLEYIKDHGARFDRILFWSYRYFPTFFGAPLVPERAVLVPTAEEDPLIRLSVLATFFSLPAGYLFLTPEEGDLVRRRAGSGLPPSRVIGSGLDPAPAHADRLPLDDLGIVAPFALYLGRIDRNKGCERLLRYFDRYLSLGGPPVQLVMAGPSNMRIPDHPLVKPLGFVDGRLREALLAQARVLVMPSPFESLSLALLEAWNHGLPVLVNGRCSVLKGQVLRADGGLYYRNDDEFATALRCLLGAPDLARQLGRQGLAYVNREYRWPIVMQKIEDLLAAVNVPR
jgi:glycosyltransferase involved in cell wall biosynthesis